MATCSKCGRRVTARTDYECLPCFFKWHDTHCDCGAEAYTDSGGVKHCAGCNKEPDECFCDMPAT